MRAQHQDKGSVSLPVLPATGGKKQTIRPSKNSTRRAIVLGLVQLLIIIHVVLWAVGAFDGKTISPVEPSEAMEFVKNGVVNAGVIFFALALLSTLILGRWFCGWGCHVVMLQDLCGWMMKKMGIRPKPFRSRVLVYVPLLLALYMFVWPAVYRWGFAPVTEQLSARHSWIPHFGPPPPWPGLSTELITTDFWKTFPGVMVAIPFLLICGFACVYFLGAKGFCTYGCPYGGFFAPADKLAPGRILVTDACEQCGHCTAVCTSNVRVHDEVREYGMVVDPGCMKCLDCVSVCPNEALYFGFSKPAVMKGQAKNKPPKRVYDLTLRGEVGIAVVFALVFFSFRGDVMRFPLLMAAGATGVITFLIWKFWRLLRDPNVNLYRRQLKLKGVIKSAGWAYAAIAVMVIAFTLHSGAINLVMAWAMYHDAKVDIPPEVTFAPNPLPMPQEMVPHAERAIALYDAVARWRLPGMNQLGMKPVDVDLRAARIECVQLAFDKAERRLREAALRDGQTDALVSSLMWVMTAQNRMIEGIEYGQQMLLEEESMPKTLESFIQLTSATGDMQRAISVCQERLERFPDELTTMRWLSMVLGWTGDFEQSIRLTKRTIEIDPTNPAAMSFLASMQAEAGRIDEALNTLRDAVKRFPNNVHLALTLAGGLGENGHIDEAIEVLREAVKRHPDHLHVNGLLAAMLEHAGRSEEAQPYREKAEQLQRELELSSNAAAH